MNYKRVEMYVGWTCNQKCTYCMEFPNMERQWTKKVTKYEILKYLIKYKKQGYNHVTLLGGEPFIQKVFLDALKISKKMNFTVLVTTNATTLHLEKQAQKFLPFIDELILSVEAIDIDLQQKISRTNVCVEWDKVFENINKYWNGTYLKANIVITKDNLPELYSLVKYVCIKGIKDVAITYPDLDIKYYGKEHLLDRVAPTYKESMLQIDKIATYCEEYNITLKIVDFPFCVFSEIKRDVYISQTDDFDYDNRSKVGTSLYEDYLPEQQEINRNEILPRERRLIDKCKECKYNNTCWGPAINYKELYGYSEINPISDNEGKINS